jgi:hypothetical protein
MNTVKPEYHLIVSFGSKERRDLSVKLICTCDNGSEQNDITSEEIKPFDSSGYECHFIHLDENMTAYSPNRIRNKLIRLFEKVNILTNGCGYEIHFFEDEKESFVNMFEMESQRILRNIFQQSKNKWYIHNPEQFFYADFEE